MKRAALVLATVMAAPAWLAAQTTVDQKRPAAPDGAVSIENMAGSVKVTGWDKAEVQVRGTVGEGGELSFKGGAKRTHIEIEADHNPMGIKSDLEVFVPAGSSVEIEGFQATISVTGVLGSVTAETVNGSITQLGAAKHVELQSVNGDIDTSKGSGRIKAEAVNGSVMVRDCSGDLEASTVHGKLHVIGGSYERAEIESVAGLVRFDAALSSRATLSIETVSGRRGAAAARDRVGGVPGVELQRPDHQRARPRGREAQQVDAADGARLHAPARAARGSRSRRSRAPSASASGRSRPYHRTNGREQMKRATILLAFALAVAPALAVAAQEEFHWTGKVAAGQAIEIKGVNGGITATGAAGGEVEVTAVKKGRKSDPTQVKVEVVEHAGGVTICAVYPSSGAPNECAPGKGGRMQRDATTT